MTLPLLSTIMDGNFAVADFETTINNPEETKVWAAGFMLDYGHPEIYDNLNSFMKRISVLDKIRIYFHNLKFDGCFIIYWLYKNGFDLAYEPEKHKYCKRKNMKSYSFSVHINRKGIWYTMTIKFKRNIVTLVDSLKVLPFSLEQAGKAFDTPHKKLDMDYSAHTDERQFISPKEREYLENDLYVLYECLQHIFNYNIDTLTIGSAALKNYKKMIGYKDYSILFPNVYEQKLKNHKYPNIGKYLLTSYSGAFVHIKKGCEKRIIRNGITIDATSLYASAQHSKLGFKYPIGKGRFFKGKARKKDNYFFFQRFSCTFKVKENYLPFIRVKGNAMISGREILESSEIYYKNSKYEEPMEITLNEYELDLFFEHYDIFNLEFLDYIEFRAAPRGIFDIYIDYWKEKKDNAKTKPDRSISKLFLTSLYGKFAAVPDSSFQLPYLNEEDALRMHPVHEEEAVPGYIPIGSAIVSFGRVIDVRAAQANYDYFIYTDTDSLHLNCSIEQVKGVIIDKNALGTFKHEISWDFAFFDNVKRYIEHVVEEDGEPCDPYYNITCAGLIASGKKNIQMALEQGENYREDIIKKYHLENESQEVQDFIRAGMQISDFTKGFKVPKGKLVSKRIKGGVILVEREFTIL